MTAKERFEQKNVVRKEEKEVEEEREGVVERLGKRWGGRVPPPSKPPWKAGRMSPTTPLHSKGRGRKVESEGGKVERLGMRWGGRILPPSKPAVAGAGRKSPTKPLKPKDSQGKVTKLGMGWEGRSFPPSKPNGNAGRKSPTKHLKPKRSHSKPTGDIRNWLQRSTRSREGRDQDTVDASAGGGSSRSETHQGLSRLTMGARKPWVTPRRRGSRSSLDTQPAPQTPGTSHKDVLDCQEVE